MAAPGHSDIIAEEGSDGAPANNTDPACGTKTTTAISDNALNKIINAPPFDATDITYYGGFYYRNTATGDLLNARVANLCACKQPPISGALTFTFVNGNDDGNKIFVCGYVSGNLLTEYVTCPDAAGSVNTQNNYDNDHIFVEFVNSAEQTAQPAGPITMSQSGITLGVWKGTAGNNGKDLAVRQMYSFVDIALRSSKNASLSFSNRLTNTADGISSYGQGLRWEGLDEAIAVPTNELSGGDYIGIAVRLNIIGNLPTPAYGRLQHGIVLVGNAVA